MEGLTRERARSVKEVFIRGKVTESGHSDWHGIILGGAALDCAEKGGVGL
jgi:hypothetical protein